ncbi:unnamed protein product [Larinioides sclopetarius]|uniref:Uncharacterized protein n=1 Tax=Larinioides sclopetarius TaxID=280406 RepID=A0AAV2A2Q2_9ARAC
MLKLTLYAKSMLDRKDIFQLQRDHRRCTAIVNNSISCSMTLISSSTDVDGMTPSLTN